MSLLATIRADFIANKVCGPEADTPLRFLKHLAWGLTFKPAFACVFWYRINRWMYLRKIPGYNLLNARRQYWFSNDITYFADIGPGLCLVHYADVNITRAKLGSNIAIMSGVTIGKKLWAPVNITIGNSCYIGTGAKIIGNVTIGKNVIVGALALVDCDVPDDSIVYGIPPNRTIKSRTNLNSS
ncbi:MAG: hypothetical protein WA021_05445 [Minisyncoccia bacterium]